jgi:hypothetical protein
MLKKRNASFLCLLNLVENNWKALTNVVNVNFPSDVQWNWKQVQDKMEQNEKDVPN